MYLPLNKFYHQPFITSKVTLIHCSRTCKHHGYLTRQTYHSTSFFPWRFDKRPPFQASFRHPFLKDKTTGSGSPSGCQERMKRHQNENSPEILKQCLFPSVIQTLVVHSLIPPYLKRSLCFFPFFLSQTR